MEGSGRASWCQSEGSSSLDIPCVVSAESFGFNWNAGKNDDILSSSEVFVSPASTAAADTDPNAIDLTSCVSGAGITLCPGPCERTDPKNSINSGPFQPNELHLSWTNKQKDGGEPCIRKSLDIFYRTCCQKKPYGWSPEYNAASQCVSDKVTELADKEGMDYALKSLHIAQMVLNRDGNKILRQHSRDTSFSTPPKDSFCLQQTKQVPGLSGDILQLIMKEKAMQ